MGSVANLLKRTDAIKNFLEDFDKVNPKLGFDTQSAIDKKLKLDKKQTKFDKKHGPKFNLLK